MLSPLSLICLLIASANADSLSDLKQDEMIQKVEKYVEKTIHDLEAIKDEIKNAGKEDTVKYFSPLPSLQLLTTPRPQTTTQRPKTTTPRLTTTTQRTTTTAPTTTRLTTTTQRTTTTAPTTTTTGSSWFWGLPSLAQPKQGTFRPWVPDRPWAPNPAPAFRTSNNAIDFQLQPLPPVTETIYEEPTGTIIIQQPMGLPQTSDLLAPVRGSSPKSWSRATDLRPEGVNSIQPRQSPQTESNQSPIPDRASPFNQISGKWVGHGTTKPQIDAVSSRFDNLWKALFTDNQ